MRGAAILVVTSTVLSLAAAEAVLRPYERRLERAGTLPGPALALLQPNPHGTGSYRLRPNLRLTARVERQQIPVDTNSLGMRWREVALERPAAKRRVAFMGDSFTFGCWSDTMESSFVGAFESRFSPERWEALGFGVGGYGLDDVELLFEEEVARFSPDYVILGFFAGNDFRDTYLGIDKHRIENGVAELDDAVVGARVPASELADDSTISHRAPPESAWERRLGRFATWRLLAPFVGREPLALDFAVNHNFTMFTYWSQFPYPAAAQEARDGWLLRLGRWDERLRQRGIRLGVVAIPFREQAYSKATSGPGYDIALPQLYVNAFARERDIPYLDLLPAFRAHIARTNARLYRRGDSHLNDEGHRLAGDAIASWFRCCVR